MHLPDDNFKASDESLRAPEKLVAALRKLPREKVFVPPTIDEAVLRAARKQLEPAPRRRPAWLRLAFGFAGASAAAVILLLSLQGPRNSERLARPIRQDINQDRVVDILDAFALARELNGPDSQTRVSNSMDINADGHVDHRDVASLAAAAVRLEKGGRS